MNHEISVLAAIRPHWCKLIFSDIKHLEIRKDKPKLATPFKVLVYCSLGRQSSKGLCDPLWLAKHEAIAKKSEECGELLNGKIIGEFVCDRITAYDPDVASGYIISNDELSQACLTRTDLVAYGHAKMLYGWHISERKLYDKPFAVTELLRPCICPEMPYCPACPKGYEYISEEEAELYRTDGECSTEWRCLNSVKRAPQSWCYIQAPRII